MNFIEELQRRGLIKGCTDLQGLVDHMKTPRSIYAGFDPTADSLTIGNLLPLIVLKIAERHGHTPVIVIGDATASIGDPSGKTKTRTKIDHAKIQLNADMIRERISRIFDNTIDIFHNSTFTQDLNLVSFLSCYGHHFSVNEMINKASVKTRLETREKGMPLNEFMYSVVQALDFMFLNDVFGVTVQIGGSDQWGNIVSGVDLIHKENSNSTVFGSKVFGLTFPLIEKSDGGKFGKTESGAIWISPHKTSPFDFFQFWKNISDVDAEKWAMMLLHSSSVECIEDLVRVSNNIPSQRLIQNELAFRITSMVHGENIAKTCEIVSDIMFDPKWWRNVNDLTIDDLCGIGKIIPRIKLERKSFNSMSNDVSVMLKISGIVSSMRISRELLNANAIEINTRKITKENIQLNSDDLLHDRFLIVKHGKKKWTLLEFV